MFCAYLIGSPHHHFLHLHSSFRRYFYFSCLISPYWHYQWLPLQLSGVPTVCGLLFQRGIHLIFQEICGFRDGYILLRGPLRIVHLDLCYRAGFTRRLDFVSFEGFRRFWGLFRQFIALIPIKFFTFFN